MDDWNKIWPRGRKHGFLSLLLSISQRFCSLPSCLFLSRSSSSPPVGPLHPLVLLLPLLFLPFLFLVQLSRSVVILLVSSVSVERNTIISAAFVWVQLNS